MRHFTQAAQTAVLTGLLAIVVPSVLSAQRTACVGKNDNISVNDNSSDHDRERTIKWKMGSCKGSLRTSGIIQFAGDMSGIRSMARGGSFELNSDDGDHEREVVVTNSNGQLNYAYRIDNRAAEWNAEARAWFSSELLMLTRRVGLAMEERIEYLLAHGGVNALVAEVKEMDSDWVQRRYLQAAMANRPLSAAEMKSVVATASTELDSDYEQAEFLLGVTKKYKLDASVRAPYLAAVGRLDSDYEKGRVLKALLRQSDLSSNEIAEVLNATTTIDSDYERTEVLRLLAGFDLSNSTLQQAFLRAATEIDSDYELRRALMALLGK
ncbi:MAG TPA: hypothetical protein VM100_04870, partial [Longimicrobiales bacterium]|nr:hypothetical protein [Longimicrobiales bacterium]